jgi:hypothetical protein
MDYEKQTVAQLKELCAQRGLSTPNKAKKADYIDILKSSPAVPPFSSDAAAAAQEKAPTDDVPSAVEDEVRRVIPAL